MPNWLCTNYEHKTRWNDASDFEAPTAKQAAEEFCYWRNSFDVEFPATRTVWVREKGDSATEFEFEVELRSEPIYTARLQKHHAA